MDRKRTDIFTAAATSSHIQRQVDHLPYDTTPSYHMNVPQSPAANSDVNVATVPQRSPFRYPGGKTWFVPAARQWLTSITPKPTTLVEPFAGGAIIALTAAFEKLAAHIVISELDADVHSVWHTILNDDDNNNAEALAARIEAFDMCDTAVRTTLSQTPTTLLDRAFITIIRNRTQHGGILAPGASQMKSGENGRGLASRWYPATLAKRIRNIAAIKHRFDIHNIDALQLIAQYSDDPACAFFIDPPYTIAGKRLYRHFDVPHAQLFEQLAAVKGNVLMTYDDTDEVRTWAKQYNFDTATVQMKSRQHIRKNELLISRDLSWMVI